MKRRAPTLSAQVNILGNRLVYVYWIVLTRNSAVTSRRPQSLPRWGRFLPGVSDRTPPRRASLNAGPPRQRSQCRVHRGEQIGARKGLCDGGRADALLFERPHL
jgi:hypothetical protein